MVSNLVIVTVFGLISVFIIIRGSLSSSEGLYDHHWVFIIISVAAGFCHCHRWIIFVVINNVLEGDVLEKYKRQDHRR